MVEKKEVKAAVAEVKPVVAEKKEEAKKVVAKKAAAPKAAKKAPAAKKTAAKKAAAPKAAKKAPAAKKAAAPKAAAPKAAKKAPVAKKTVVEPKKFMVQTMAGAEISYTDIVKKVNKAISENIKSLEIYVKAEEGKAYYVVNGDITGAVELF